MKKLLPFILGPLLATGICGLAMANHHGKGHAKAKTHDQHQAASHSQELNISTDLRLLLNQEMQQIRGGMESLVFANVAGDWDKIAKVGGNIKHSYIMAQKLTKEQRHQLHDGLPEGFKVLDKKLHHYAGMLSAVAKKHDRELVNYFIYKMSETCTACHAQYAAEKFPGFTKKNAHQSDHH